MSDPLSFRSITQQGVWPELEKLFEDDPSQMEALVDQWLANERRAIASVATACNKGRREFRSNASLNMSLLATKAANEGYSKVAKALESARSQIW